MCLPVVDEIVTPLDRDCFLFVLSRMIFVSDLLPSLPTEQVCSHSVLATNEARDTCQQTKDNYYLSLEVSVVLQRCKMVSIYLQCL